METLYLSHLKEKFLKAENYTKVLVLLLGLVLTGSLTLLEPPGSKYTATFDTESSPKVTLEIAETPEEREKGLMYRKNLEENHGMIFIFPEEKTRRFWMRNTYVPLDIIYLDSKLRIIDIKQAEPHPNASLDQLKIYRSSEPAKYVIELNQGFSEKHGIEPGTRLVPGPRLESNIKKG